MPPKFDTLSDNKEASTEEEDIPVLAVISTTLIIEFGSEILLGKVIFKDVMASLQSSHENTAIIGSAWTFLHEKSKSLVQIKFAHRPFHALTSINGLQSHQSRNKHGNSRSHQYLSHQ
jgi:hypothetical protein